MKLTHAVAALALALAALTGVGVSPASAKSQALSPASCTGGSTGQISYAKVGGNRYNVGFSTTDAGIWNVKISVDADAPRTDYTSTNPTGGLNLIAVIAPSKGKHSFTIVATNLTTGGTCNGYIPPGA